MVDFSFGVWYIYIVGYWSALQIKIGMADVLKG